MNKYDMMDRERLVLRLHELGMHDDHWFHDECPICVETSVSGYLEECHEILRAMGKDEEVIQTFEKSLRANPYVTATLHYYPGYIIAEFFGIFKTGDELEADPEFQLIQTAAMPIVERRNNEAMSKRLATEHFPPIGC